jgi:DNA primase
MPVLEYISSRAMYLEDYPFYWSNDLGFRSRLIVPFYHNKQIVGWTARSVNGQMPKYLSEQQPGYVFNLDRQHWDRKYVIVCEGPFDAISIDGVALLGSEIKQGQHLLINQLQRQVILVPDRDAAGEKTVEQAIEFGWSVSFPPWPEGVKDINDAVRILGRPATLWLIINSAVQTELKIKLQSKNWFRKEQ